MTFGDTLKEGVKYTGTQIRDYFKKYFPNNNGLYQIVCGWISDSLVPNKGGITHTKRSLEEFFPDKELDSEDYDGEIRIEEGHLNNTQTTILMVTRGKYQLVRD